jgi:hypothetical protein
MFHGSVFKQAILAAHLIPTPKRMPHDVDNGAEAADSFVIPVDLPSLIVVVLCSNLYRGSLSYVTYNICAKKC